ncbi:MAG: dienelactone hydrolase family protein [Terriglobales bacterium]
MRIPVIALIALGLAVNAFGADGKSVNYKSGDETVSGVLFVPPGGGPFPALVLIHEWWGMNDWAKGQAARLADQGYVTLAIDLYRGKVATNPEEAHELMRGVPEDRAARDLLAAFDYLVAQKNVDGRRIGDIGWCMGGGYAFDLAVSQSRLKAAVINYGHLASDVSTVQGMNAAFLGIFGAQDKGIPEADVRRFQEQMKAAGKKVEIVIYPDAGHGFENPNNKDGYRPQDAADAWNKTVAFLDANLKK